MACIFSTTTFFYLKLDYCGHYRLWETGSSQLPKRHSDFFDVVVTCSKVALKFAAVVANENAQWKKLARISPVEALALSPVLLATSSVPRTPKNEVTKIPS